MKKSQKRKHFVLPERTQYIKISSEYPKYELLKSHGPFGFYVVDNSSGARGFYYIYIILFFFTVSNVYKEYIQVPTKNPKIR